ncbi:MAG: radical SAM protein [Acidobacteria bacterium]|nr:radical SAM protein [Acidobacteriota bacterium]
MMRRPGSILLISCYELGHQPSGIAWPMAFLERAGYRPDALDISVERCDADQVARARFVGISVPMHTALRLGVRLAERVRRINPNCHICFYGLYAILNAPYLLNTVADSVTGGEFEQPLVELVQSLEQDSGRSVTGVSFRGGGRAAPFLGRLNFPLPMRAGLPPLDLYARLEYGGRRRLAGQVEASRGCLHGCLHCPIPPLYGGRFFIVPRDVVLADIRQQVACGAEHISFGDPDFLNGPGHSLKIVRSMHAEFPKLTFDFTAKVSHILRRRSLFPELDKLGCLFVVSAVESLSDTVLGHLEKGHTRADIPVALQVVRRAGIAFRPTWVPFTPWTSLQDYRDMLDFIEEEGLIDDVDAVQYAIRLLVPPGSGLLSRKAIAPFLGPLDEASFSYRWSHPDPRMDRLHQQISAVVAKGVQRGDESPDLFSRVYALAWQAAGDSGVTDEPRPQDPAPTLRARRSALCLPVSMPGPVARRTVAARRPGRPAPRLTEPWFC